MRVIAKVIKPAPAAFWAPGGWAKAVEDDALQDLVDRLEGNSPWSFIDDAEVVFERAANRVLYIYHVPSVLPIRGAMT